jgi:hypothetical protein
MEGPHNVFWLSPQAIIQAAHGTMMTDTSGGASDPSDAVVIPNTLVEQFEPGLPPWNVVTVIYHTAFNGSVIANRI